MVITAGSECGRCIPDIMVCNIWAKSIDTPFTGPGGFSQDLITLSFRWCMYSMYCFYERTANYVGAREARRALPLKPDDTSLAQTYTGMPTGAVPFETTNFLETFLLKTPPGKFWTEKICCKKDRKWVNCPKTSSSPGTLGGESITNCCDQLFEQIVSCCMKRKGNPGYSSGTASSWRGTRGTCHSLLSDKECCGEVQKVVPLEGTQGGAFDVRINDMAANGTMAEAIMEAIADELEGLLGSCDLKSALGGIRIPPTTGGPEPIPTTPNPCENEFNLNCICGPLTPGGPLSGDLQSDKCP